MCVRVETDWHCMCPLKVCDDEFAMRINVFLGVHANEWAASCSAGAEMEGG